MDVLFYCNFTFLLDLQLLHWFFIGYWINGAKFLLWSLFLWVLHRGRKDAEFAKFSLISLIPGVKLFKCKPSADPFNRISANHNVKIAGLNYKPAIVVKKAQFGWS